MSPPAIVFMGTANLACASLAVLTRQSGLRVIAVVTRPDRPQGRELRTRPPPVKALAAKQGLPVLQPEHARDEQFIAQLKALRPDLIVVAAYGQILPSAILELPRFGCINVHASLLPRYRGAAPIQWALLNGDTETGVTIMKMDVGLDTGDILAQEAAAILPQDNAETLQERVAALGAQLLLKTIPDYVAGKITPRPQATDGVSLAPKLKKEDGRMDWTQPALALWNRVRALNPWPGAFTRHAAGPKPTLLKIWQTEVEEAGAGQPGEILRADKTGLVVACGRQALRILELQREGGRRLAVREFMAGSALKTAQRLE